MNLFLFSIMIVSVNSGVLKNAEDQPIIHAGTQCGSTKCPDDYRCELPMSNADCDNEDGCSTTPKCVPIPITKTTCEDNEELKECGSTCEPTCDNQNPECAPTCLTNVCQCKQGFVRDSALGKCVEKNNCSKCMLECSENEKCELVEVTCELKPCQVVDVCVSKNDGSQVEEE